MAFGTASVFVWLLMVLSVTAQCTGPIPSNSDIDGLSNVNLDVKCNGTGVKLNISSGGIYVNRVRIFQECVAGYNISNATSSGESQITEIWYDTFESRTDDEREEFVPLNPMILANMECSYYGCYKADRIMHVLPYVLKFTAKTKCTFEFTKETQRATAAAPSSSLPLDLHTETSMNTAILIYHTLTQRMPSRAAMTSMQLSSMSALQLQPTPVTFSNKEQLSISHQSPDTPTPPTLAMVTKGNVNGVGLQWMALLILFPVILVTLVGVCLLLRRADMRQEKNKFQYVDHTDWTKEDHIDEDFFPVFVDPPPKSPSSQSIQTILDVLYSTSSHSASCKTSGGPMHPSNAPGTNNNNCVLDNIQSRDSDCEEHLKEEQDFQTTSQPNERQEHPEKFLTHVPDPLANVYNYSLDSREYVLVSPSYTHVSTSTILTTVTGDSSA